MRMKNQRRNWLIKLKDMLLKLARELTFLFVTNSDERDNDEALRIINVTFT
jgi:hypothetical protein